MKKQKRTLSWENLSVENFVTNLRQGEVATLAGGKKSVKFYDEEIETC